MISDLKLSLEFRDGTQRDHIFVQFLNLLFNSLPSKSKVAIIAVYSDFTNLKLNHSTFTCKDTERRQCNMISVGGS